MNGSTKGNCFIFACLTIVVIVGMISTNSMISLWAYAVIHFIHFEDKKPNENGDE